MTVVTPLARRVDAREQLVHTLVRLPPVVRGGAADRLTVALAAERGDTPLRGVQLDGGLVRDHLSVGVQKPLHAPTGTEAQVLQGAVDLLRLSDDDGARGLVRHYNCIR